jgi:molybdopterin converting factor small subunit
MDKPLTITLLYFAAAQTALGIATETVELPHHSQQPTSNDSHSGFPLSGLVNHLVARHVAKGSDLKKVLQISRWCVDAEMIEDPDTVWLHGGEEVAVIPPVSGG